MEFKIYDVLPEEARTIRTEVFTNEQGFKAEFDEIDKCAKHIVMFESNIPEAVCRFYKDGNDYIIGRIAVVKAQRGRGLGAKILEAAEAEIKRIGGKRAVLHAQERAKEFYKRQGYIETPNHDFDENCPHVWMYKSLDKG